MAEASNGRIVGAKAAALARLADAGLPVPPFVVLPDSLRQAFLATVADPGNPEVVRRAPWPAACREAVRGALGGLGETGGMAGRQGGRPAGRPYDGGGGDGGLVAVRSSMVGEDGARWSYAGQLDTFLDVPADVDAPDSRLLAAIQACWASAAGGRAEAYRRLGPGAADPSAGPDEPPHRTHVSHRSYGSHGSHPPPAPHPPAPPAPAMGVILQTMVDARAAGVLFTVDPLSGDRSCALLSVAPGTGEALVQGAVAGETLRLDRATGRALDPCELLSEAEIEQLWQAALAAEGLGGGPQDIEFAFGSRGLALLQARPVTASAGAGAAGSGDASPSTAGGDTAPVAPIDAATAAADPETILWDNSNITESYAGVTAPLTLSLIRRAYAGVYRQFLQLMGVARPDEDLLQNLLGFYHGQVYYQLDRWYAALALLPAFQQNRAFLEQMMGVRQAADGPPPAARGGQVHLLAWLLRMIRLHLGAARRTAAFHRQVGAELERVAALDLETLTPRQLQGVFRRLETEVLGRWQAPILADFMTMVFVGLLRRLSARWLPDRPGILGELLVAGGPLASLEPLRALVKLADLARSDPALLAQLGAPTAGTWERLADDPARAAFHAACRDYLDRYGDRCANELQLEVPNLRDDPARLLRLVAVAAARPAAGPAAAPGRTVAEARVDGLPWPRRRLYRWILGQARRYVQAREAQRLVRSRVFGQLRRLFGALGRRFAQAGRLAEGADIFYLTVDEVFSEVSGTAIDLDLRALVAMRRSAYAAFRTESWPERFATEGPPYWGPPQPLRGTDGGGAVADAPFLQGMGCSAGRISGRVRVVQQVDEALDLSGEILVAARTDPGWVFLFPGAAGLLVERGSPLSHSAIVARELGLPTIVNIPGLTERLRTGDWVTMDGAGGGIWRHGPAAAGGGGRASEGNRAGAGNRAGDEDGGGKAGRAGDGDQLSDAEEAG